MSILDDIVDHKKDTLATAQRLTPTEELKSRLRENSPVHRPFAAALNHPGAGGDIALIAEIKQASPSAGVIAPDMDPVAIAQRYESGGADALSILTEAGFFQGSLNYLNAVRAVCGLPLLRKDFLFDPYQLYESRAFGADAILLIATILELNQLRELLALAAELRLEVLVEIHDEWELEKVLQTGAGIIGINTRNLADFSEDLGLFARLAPRIPADRLRVAESSIRTRTDVELVRASGASAVLVGTALMKHETPEKLIRTLKGVSDET
jgi:indole-3-glycerol phosphate synthase